MSNQQVITPLNQLTVDKQDWVVCVNVHNIWTQSYKNTPNQIANKEMVLVDQQGTKIHATIKKNLLYNFGDSLEQGNTVEISTFNVESYSGNWLMADNAHKITFCRATRVKRVDGIQVVGNGYSFIPYAHILAGQHNTNIAFDVVGQVVKTGNMQIREQDGWRTKKITFVLQDVDGTQLDCALWGDYAVQLNTYVEKSKSSEDVTIMFIHVAFAKPWDHKVQVSNSFFGTKVYINNDIQPIVEFRERLMQNAAADVMPTPPPVLTINTVVEKSGDFYMRFPRKTIDCMRTIRETMHCVVVAKLLNVVSEDGWFYYICKSCSKTVTRNLEATPDGYELSCYECGPINETDQKVRTVIQAEDSTGATSFTMFGDVVARFLKKTEQWLNIKMQKSADPTVVPPEWEAYINQQVVLKVKVTMYNVTNECAGYTVGRCTDDPEVVAAQLQRPIATDLETNDHSFVTPNNKGIVSMSGVNVSPVPFEDLEVEGSNNKRKIQSLEDDVVTENTCLKKPLSEDE